MVSEHSTVYTYSISAGGCNNLFSLAGGVFFFVFFLAAIKLKPKEQMFNVSFFFRGLTFNYISEPFFCK